MLSIIICSVKPSLLDALRINIQNTIGIEYEIIAHDNRIANLPLTQVYNTCSIQAQYSNLLFLHEDVAFHSYNWGESLIKLLQDESIGLVGISGAIYKSAYPSTWSMVPQQYYRITALQRWRDGRITEHNHKENPNANYSQVVVIDGVFLAMRKKVWTQHQFDTQYLKGFHFYDMHASIQIGLKYKVVVTHQILLEHFSEGNLNADWINESIQFHDRNKIKLPLVIPAMPKHEQRNADYHAITAFTFLLIKHRYYMIATKCLLKAILKAPMHKTNVDMVKYFIKSLYRSMAPLVN